MKRQIFLGSLGAGALVAPRAAAALSIIRPKPLATLVSDTVFYATLNGKSVAIYQRIMYTTEVVFLIPNHGSFVYTPGCDVTNVFGVNCNSTSGFTAPSGAGSVSIDQAADTATVHFPVPQFDPSYTAKGDGGGGGNHPRPKGLRPLNHGDVVYTSVEFGVATAGMCFAALAFEATPVGWAATGVGLVAYGMSAWDLWRVQ